MNCPGCERTIPDYHVRCPHCGMIFSGEVPFPLDPDPEPCPEPTQGDQTETAVELQAPGRKPNLREELRQRLSPGEPGRYSVLRKIGSGGMGTVYKIYDHKLERFAAMKRLSPDRADLNGLRTFVTEAKAIALLNHGNIVTIFDINEDARGFFILMEYVRGLSLRAWVKKFGAIPTYTAINLLRQVADALCYGHRLGVIHRDVKPGNILVTEGLTPKLVDFGVALISSDKSESGRRRVAGTQGYMAPEQRWKGRPADQRSDVYAFAMTLVEVVVGMKPWLVKRIPPEIESFVKKGTAENPRDRFQSMEEVIDTLDEMTDHFTEAVGDIPEPVAARIKPTTPRTEWLQALDGRRRRYPLRQPISYIGRSGDEADLVLPDTEVSRRHAKVVRSGHDTYMFDLKSKNGISVDDKTVSVIRLTDGLVLTLGTTQLQYNCRENEVTP